MDESQNKNNSEKPVQTPLSQVPSDPAKPQYQTPTGIVAGQGGLNVAESETNSSSQNTIMSANLNGQKRKSRLLRPLLLAIAVLIALGGVAALLIYPKVQARNYAENAEVIVDKIGSEAKLLKAKTFNPDNTTSTSDKRPEEIIKAYEGRLAQLESSSKVSEELREQLKNLKGNSRTADVNNQINTLLDELDELIKKNQDDTEITKSSYEEIARSITVLNGLITYVYSGKATFGESLSRTILLYSMVGDDVEFLEGMSVSNDEKPIAELRIKTFKDLHSSLGKMQIALKRGDQTAFSNEIETLLDTNKQNSEKTKEAFKDYYENSEKAKLFEKIDTQVEEVKTVLTSLK